MTRYNKKETRCCDSTGTNRNYYTMTSRKTTKTLRHENPMGRSYTERLCMYIKIRVWELKNRTGVGMAAGG